MYNKWGYRYKPWGKARNGFWRKFLNCVLVKKDKSLSKNLSMCYRRPLMKIQPISNLSKDQVDLHYIGWWRTIEWVKFFPSYTIDQGYKVLLSRQYRSGLDANKTCVFLNFLVSANSTCSSGVCHFLCKLCIDCSHVMFPGHHFQLLIAHVMDLLWFDWWTYSNLQDFLKCLRNVWEILIYKVFRRDTDFGSESARFFSWGD